MRLYNLKDSHEEVSFSKAVQLGLGKKQGLFFPLELPKLNTQTLTDLMSLNFIDRSTKILSYFLHDEISSKDLKNIVKKSFSFQKPILKSISKNIACLELFHGPTLAFKDFGARFMANILQFLNVKNTPMTILTATSGDTGAAVAHAFYKMKNIRVIILYPNKKISTLQEKLFCTLGNNIYTIAINGSFDDCQNLVKKAFNDQDLKKKIILTSANSINISRLLAQICYYFEAFSKTPFEYHKKLIISVPCGNFGNLTAGLLAKSLGLPIKNFIAATNSNNTVPNFLKTGIWNPKKTISTISNAMDISRPNNWPRVKELFLKKKWSLKSLKYGSVSERNTKNTLKKLYNLGYISEPHAAIAYYLLKKKIKKTDYGLFFGTAHPTKFKNIVENILKINLKLPEILKKYNKKKMLSHFMKPNFEKLKKILLEKF